MTERQPSKRLDAIKCINHPFFISGETLQNFQVNVELEEVGKFKKKKDDVNSFVVNSGVINGQVHTIDDSGSKGEFVSIKQVSKKGNKNSMKRKPRASIYRAVLDRNVM